MYYKPGILLQTRFGQCSIRDETQSKTLGHFKVGESGRWYIRVLAPGGIVGTVLDTEVTIVPKSREP